MVQGAGGSDGTADRECHIPETAGIRNPGSNAYPLLSGRTHLHSVFVNE